MGHDIPERIRIPDYTEYSYKEVNKFPHLVKYQEELAREGLKDPWIRNYFWMYKSNPKYINGKKNYFRNLGSVASGALLAVCVFGAYIVFDQTRQKLFGGGKEEHGHGHH